MKCPQVCLQLTTGRKNQCLIHFPSAEIYLHGKTNTMQMSSGILCFIKEKGLLQGDTHPA